MIRLYHGSQEENVKPTFGLGSSRHDFGAGFYLTDSAELAMEWSVCRPGCGDGWIHAFDLDVDGLKIFDFRNADVLKWVAELMKHRDADESSAYRKLHPLPDLRQNVSFAAYHPAYENRDGEARDAMRRMIADPEFNGLERVFSDLTRGA